MSKEKWTTLRDWIRRVFGPAAGIELFYAHVEEAREIGAECPSELGPGF